MEALSLFSREPHWYTRHQLPRDRFPLGLRDWLFDASSLTRRLTAFCSGTFWVQVLDQAQRLPTLSERRVLGIRSGRRALIRQVRLYCGQTPWVFARTVIPLATLSGRNRALSNLGARPLGGLLFADPHMERSAVEVARLRPGMPLHRRAMDGDGSETPIWGRRSCFYLQGKPLLVSEYFLPDFLTALAEAGHGTS